NDTPDPLSDFGPKVRIFAPGVNVTSDWSTNDNATSTQSGSSMATPHVAGAAARYLQLHPTASPVTVEQAILLMSTQNAVHNPGAGSPNLLLYTDDPATGPPSVSGDGYSNCINCNPLHPHGAPRLINTLNMHGINFAQNGQVQFEVHDTTI